MDETYIKVKGKWVYLYRAVDSHGDTLDFMLSERRDEDAASAFFKQAINNNVYEYCCYPETHRIKPAIAPSAQKHTSLYAFELPVTNARLQWLFIVHRAFLAKSLISSACAIPSLV
jgi:hypothetical protein